MRKPKKIALLVFPLANPNRECGQTYLTELIKILTCISKDVYVITGNFIPNFESEAKIISVVAPIVSLEQETIFSKVKRFFLAQIIISLELIKLSRMVDTVILFTLAGPLFLPLIFGKILGKRIIVISAGFNSQIIRGMYQSALGMLFSSILQLIEELNYNFSDKIVILSPYMSNSIRSRYHRKLITNGYHSYIDSNRFTIEQPIEKRKPIVGYVGRITSEKGVMELADAIPLIGSERKDVEFLIIGVGPMLASMKKKLAGQGNLDNVTFAGWIPNNMLTKYLNNMKLLIIPSYTEGLPKVLFEAMACGTPVLATRVGGIPDIIRDQENGFLMDENTPESIKKNILRALDNRNLNKISMKGRDIVINEYDFSSAVKRYIDVLGS